MGMYLNKTLGDLRGMQLGLLGNLLLAKLEGQEILNKTIGATDADNQPLKPIVTEYFEKEAELTRDAIVTFLTDPDNIHWTVSNLKASVEIENMSTSGPLLATVTTTTQNVVTPTSVAGPTNTYGAMLPGAMTAVGYSTGVGLGVVAEPLVMAKNGGRHGANLVATGHAHIGITDIVPGSDTTEQDNTFTKVQLFRHNIKMDALK